MKAHTPPSAKKKFFFLVSAQIVFTVKGSDAPSSCPINATVINDKDQLPSAMIGKAQQAVQMQLMKKLGEEFQNIQIVDVVIHNIVTLGYMTEEEFLAPPKAATPAEAKAVLKSVK